MKKIAMTSALVMLGTAMTLCAFAQTPKAEKFGKAGKAGIARKGKEGRIMGRMGKMMGDLNLTDAQKAKVKTLQEDVATKRKAITDDKTLTEDAKKEKMKDLVKTMRGDFEKILIPEQKTKMAELRKEQRGKLAKGANRSNSAAATGTPAPKKP